ncbi:hypothetical protein OE749_09670 [Aestuariibacter sp. AA17]|uniref:DUF1795 domain-containing protein n=1 Tax=Fluctibacter corallii TaxID=2984329 RepID=A0ABT3A8P9_9ALTE|nr:hypothetical protein [Aestuariibacter sp. AA17]MCV2884964.1 hypothetical protein [Aestuariibacter sp. AA17]
MKLFALVISVLFVISGCASSVSSNSENTFRHSPTGLEVTKLNGWYFHLPFGEVGLTESLILKDERFRQAINAHAEVPLVMISNSEDPESIDNPYIRIMARKSPNLVGTDMTVLLESVIHTISRVYGETSWVEKPRPVSIDGYNGATCEIEATVSIRHLGEKTSNVRLYIVMKEDTVFTIGWNSPSEIREETVDDLEKIVSTITL